MISKRLHKIVAIACLGVVLPFVATSAFASSETGEGGHGAIAGLLAMFAVLLFAAKVGNLVEKISLPPVVGELSAGIVLSALGFVLAAQYPDFGSFIDAIRHSEVMAFVAEFGVILLLFSIGLESNVKDMVKVGPRALLVAIIGATLPFVIGTWVLGPLLFAEADFVTHLFIGASLVATSVGITASVYKALGKNHLNAFKTFLGASVIDDVIGLVVLAVVSAIATTGEVGAMDVLILVIKAVAFLVGAIAVGKVLAKPISELFSAIHTGTGMKLALALTFALIFAFLASLVGLAPIVGAFAAGLLLDGVHFENFEDPEIVKQLRELETEHKLSSRRIKHLIHRHRHAHVEDLIGNLGLVFVPIFFVYTGLQIDVSSLTSLSIYIFGVIIAIVAILSKLAAGLGASGSRQEKLLVGVSMVPRGEVGLIFAATGLSLGAITNEVFSIIILVVLITTFFAPPVIPMLIKKVEKKA